MKNGREELKRVPKVRWESLKEEKKRSEYKERTNEKLEQMDGEEPGRGLE